MGGELVVCDCTFKDEDHLVSVRTRRRHRKIFTRRLIIQETSSLNQTVPSSQLPDNRFHDTEDDGSDVLMMDDGIPNIEGPVDEGSFELENDTDDHVEDEFSLDSEAQNDTEDQSADRDDGEDEAESVNSMVAEGDLSDEEQDYHEVDELAPLKALSSTIHWLCI
jgi:hypothetical protein